MSNGKVLELEEADPEVDIFGVAKVEDFRWTAMLDMATCTECGRCQSQCPAWNTGKPLSPKLLIMNLRDHLFAKAPYILGSQTAPEDHVPDFHDAGTHSADSGHVPESGYERVMGTNHDQAVPAARRHRRGGRGHRPRRPVELHHLRRLRRAVPGRHRARRPHPRHAPLPGAHRERVPERGRRDAAQPRERAATRGV